MYHNASHTAARSNHDREPLIVVAVPAVTLVGSRLAVGDANSTSTRSYTPLKVIGDGSFGTVWLCDWHGLLPPNTPLSPMQCGAGARPEWAGKRLVAVKRMKKRWEGGWDECKKLKELEALRAIPAHPNLIPLYDFFLLPSSKELYFVFESMEGNLYQLIKSRKSRPLAGGLVSAIFRQITAGLHHIHASGYFHRDMKPENLLVTTTGIADYASVSPVAPPNAPPEKDVVVIIKLADFGLARETASRPPYTEYVSTRWYRAPEVLLHSRDYSNPVDLWALGTIMAELVNLRPLFPGQGEIDQVIRICQCLGDPSDEYGVDSRGRSIGGGPWERGIKLASTVGFTFPKHTPVQFFSLFESFVPHSLIECICDLLKFDPAERLTSQDCVDHQYLKETAHSHPQPPAIVIALPPNPTQVRPILNGRSPISGGSHGTLHSVSPRSVPPSHSQSPHPNGRPHPNGAFVPILQDPPPVHRIPFYQRPAEDMPTAMVVPALPAAQPSPMQDVDMHLPNDHSPDSYHSLAFSVGNGWASDLSLQDLAYAHVTQGTQNGVAPAMHIHESPTVRTMNDEDPNMSVDGSQAHLSNATSHSKPTKAKKGRWGFGSMFGHHDKMSQPLPPVDELNVASTSSTPSLKRTQSGGSSDSRSLQELSPTSMPPPAVVVSTDPKKVKKEAERIAREAEKQRRILAEKTQREQAKAVMQKRSQVLKATGERTEVEWLAYQRSGVEVNRPTKSKISLMPPTVAAAGGRYGAVEPTPWTIEEERRLSDQMDTRFMKARRRDLDDDHSMSSSDVPSVARMSVMSFATVDSDPGPRPPVRHRPSAYHAISRATSYSSLRTPSSRALSPSARSSTSIEGQLVHDFKELATFGSQTSSPPPMQHLSLSPGNGHQHWQDVQYTGQQYTPNVKNLTLPPVSSFDGLQQLRVPGSPYGHGHSSHPSSPGAVSPNINPMFQVPNTEAAQPSLPPFSQLAFVAEQHEEPRPMLPPLQEVSYADGPPG